MKSIDSHRQRGITRQTMRRHINILKLSPPVITILTAIDTLLLYYSINIHTIIITISGAGLIPIILYTTAIDPFKLCSTDYTLLAYSILINIILSIVSTFNILLPQRIYLICSILGFIIITWMLFKRFCLNDILQRIIHCIESS